MGGRPGPDARQRRLPGRDLERADRRKPGARRENLDRTGRPRPAGARRLPPVRVQQRRRPAAAQLAERRRPVDLPARRRAQHPQRRSPRAPGRRDHAEHRLQRRARGDQAVRRRSHRRIHAHRQKQVRCLAGGGGRRLHRGHLGKSHRPAHRREHRRHPRRAGLDRGGRGPLHGADRAGRLLQPGRVDPSRQRRAAGGPQRGDRSRAVAALPERDVREPVPRCSIEASKPAREQESICTVHRNVQPRRPRRQLRRRRHPPVAARLRSARSGSSTRRIWRTRRAEADCSVTDDAPCRPRASRRAR